MKVVVTFLTLIALIATVAINFSVVITGVRNSPVVNTSLAWSEEESKDDEDDFVQPCSTYVPTPDGGYYVDGTEVYCVFGSIDCSPYYCQ